LPRLAFFLSFCHLCGVSHDDVDLRPRAFSNYGKFWEERIARICVFNLKVNAIVSPQMRIVDIS